MLSEFERILAKAPFKVFSKQLESTLAPDLRTVEPPRAQVYVIDAHAVCWSAARIARRRAVCLPARPSHDARGLPMAIWY